MNFVDLHLHLLPGIDDGAKTLEDSLEMARALTRLGFTQAAPSPHARDEYASGDAALCATKLNEVRVELQRAGIALELHSNAENFFLEPALFPAMARTLGTGKVLLVEAPYQGPLPMLGDLIFRMKLKGVTPLIAHPERCFEFEAKNRAADVVGQGALLQLDIGALIGRYGKTAQKLARKLLREGLYAEAATHLHSPVGAEKWVGDSIKALEKAVGAKVASQLLSERPAKLLSGVTE